MKDSISIVLKGPGKSYTEKFEFPLGSDIVLSQNDETLCAMVKTARERFPDTPEKIVIKATLEW